MDQTALTRRNCWNKCAFLVCWWRQCCAMWLKVCRHELAEGRNHGSTLTSKAISTSAQQTFQVRLTTERTGPLPLPDQLKLLRLVQQQRTTMWPPHGLEHRCETEE